MTDITSVIISIIILFCLFLSFRTLLSFKICALCAAVSSTWIILLVLFYLGHAVDPVLAAVLMGGSVVGAMYLLEAKLPAEYAVFKLPFYLSFTWGAYVLVKGVVRVEDMVIIAVLWAVFAGLFFWRDSHALKTSVKKIIECCKNW